MDKRVKALWLTALRSGEYKQGTTVLRNDWNEFCCLGVLCDLWVKEGEGEWNVDQHGHKYSINDGESGGFGIRTGVLPRTVMEWSGMNTSDGLYDGGTLTDDNDDGKSFSAIADIIEVYL